MKLTLDDLKQRAAKMLSHVYTRNTGQYIVTKICICSYQYDRKKANLWEPVQAGNLSEVYSNYSILLIGVSKEKNVLVSDGTSIICWPSSLPL